MPPTVEEQLRAGIVPEGFRIPSYSELSVMMNTLVTERDGEWCGMPLPLPGLGLVLEDRHPGKALLAQLQEVMDGTDEPESETDAQAEATRAAYEDTDIRGWREVNSWRGRTRHGVTGIISILRHEDGRTTWGLRPDLIGKNRLLLSAFETLDAWNLETECTAIDMLATLLTERMFKAYALTGMFLETSKRSGLTYWFRRLAPTVVLTPHRQRDEMEVLCALCLHPLGYYATTRCGAMTPTDDVIAHLLMMRGWEEGFWRKANQHPPGAPEAGL